MKTEFYEPTGKQLAFYNTLAKERGLPTIEDFDVQCTRKAASEAINALMKLPKAKTTGQFKTKVQLTLDDTDNPAKMVPAGRYAVTGEDGTTDFYKVNIGKAGGKWEGFTFLDHQQGPTMVPVKAKALKTAILAKIAADPKGAAIRYGKELGICGICTKTLTNPESIEAGIGPVCAGKMGW